MEIAGIKNNSYVNSYYSNKADKIKKEVGKDGMQQEQSEKGRREMLEEAAIKFQWDFMAALHVPSM